MRKLKHKNLLSISLALIAIAVINLPLYIGVLLKYSKLDEAGKRSFIQSLDVGFMESLIFLLFPALFAVFIAFGLLILRERYLLISENREKRSESLLEVNPTNSD